MTEMAGIEAPLHGIPVPDGYKPHPGDVYRCPGTDEHRIPNWHDEWMIVRQSPAPPSLWRMGNFVPVFSVLAWNEAAGREFVQEFLCLPECLELHPDTFARHLERAGTKAG